MTDSALSLEGKANYLSRSCNATTSHALIVVPLLAGWDRAIRLAASSSTTGRWLLRALRLRDIGSGTPFAESALRLGYRTDLDREAALELGLSPFTKPAITILDRGPDFVRNIYPMMVTITSEGFQELSSMTWRHAFTPSTTGARSQAAWRGTLR